MNHRKIYKFNKKQFELIVGGQKNSPQLQTEILDSLTNDMSKLLTWGFKQSINAFKYFQGIGVNIYVGDSYYPDGAYPVKKNNPLAPLSIYNSSLTGLPKKYEQLFKTLTIGIKAANVTRDKNVINELTFDDVDEITYPIKFEFQNLRKNVKENADIMTTTWNLMFNVKCNGKVTSNNDMEWELVKFISQGTSLNRALSKNDNKSLSQIWNQLAGGNVNEMSLIFTDQSQAQKLATGVKKQIDDNMKLLVGKLNNNIGGQNIIKIPTVKVTVSPNLIGNSQPKQSNQSNVNQQPNIKDINKDIVEIQRQINFYRDQDQYKDKVLELEYLLNKLNNIKNNTK